MEQMSKEEVIERLQRIREQGWIANTRPGNNGGVGNTLEDLLGIQENNLPIPNAAEWELKSQRVNKRWQAGSYTTLLHSEPSPRAMKFVPSILLPLYGWSHQKAGEKYPVDEMSFRQTINARNRSDRGFCVVVDNTSNTVRVSFDANAVDRRKHGEWLQQVEQRVGLGELDPQPYWAIDELFHSVAAKLRNCFYVLAQHRKRNDLEEYYYGRVYMLARVSTDKFIEAIATGNIYVDFDARTGHNHGTKFRMKAGLLPSLYAQVTEI